jgi:hypothetical protein
MWAMGTIELWFLMWLVAPVVVKYLINYLMFMLMQIFSGHLDNSELVVALLGNSVLSRHVLVVRATDVFTSYILMCSHHT